ncbi:MAG TPA: hypothetical protein VLE53_02450 [Gemmatimonadaceae bacterium]|nr:hypothetical protein [Gemmatimonadaceae bacterium]
MNRRSTPRIALATAEHLPDLTTDDQHLLLALRARGVRAEPLVWQDTGVDLPDAVIIRSCWDYHLRVEEFFDWVDRLDRAGVTVLNPPSLLSWNAHKRYLDGLSAVVSVPARIWLARGGEEGDPVLPAEWERAVFKPAISASAHETWLAELPLGDAQRTRLRDQRARSDVMAQRFVNEILTAGELSFVFIDGQYSHAVGKRPAAGDFRVQAEHGGSAELAHPRSSEIRTAAAVVAAAPAIPLYARVDAVVTPAAFQLMELELIDPQLFFIEAAQPLDGFVEAILARVRA